LSQRAGELGARVDRGYLGRFNPKRLAKLDADWLAAGSAATKALAEDVGTEALVQACDGLRTLVAELEDIMTRAVDSTRVAALKEREWGTHFVRGSVRQEKPG
jgi:hypothetical protein